MMAWFSLFGCMDRSAGVPPAEGQDPFGGAAPLPGRGDAAMKSLRKKGRTAVAVL